MDGDTANMDLDLTSCLATIGTTRSRTAFSTSSRFDDKPRKLSIGSGAFVK